MAENKRGEKQKDRKSPELRTGGGGISSGPGSSLDPRAGLLGFVAVTASAVCLPDNTPFWKLAAIFVGLIASNYLLNRQPEKLMRKMFHLLTLILPFFIFLVPLTLLFPGEKGRTPAGTLFNLGQIAARMTIIIAADVVFILGQRPEDIMAALHQSHLPQAIIRLLTSAVRYYQILTAEAVTSFRAKASRETCRRPIMERFKITGLIIEKIFRRVMDRSQRLYAAMLSRGYEGQMFFMKRFRFGQREVVFVVALAGILLAAALI